VRILDDYCFYREFEEGWATDPGRDSYLEYRLTIDNATVEDSGTYRCVTPARYAHEISIEVTSMINTHDRYALKLVC
jgi:hypothetical protein